jgi:hypothetical protein
MNKHFTRLLREKFLAGLEAKTGWGKNDVANLFEYCLAEAAIECLDAQIVTTGDAARGGV